MFEIWVEWTNGQVECIDTADTQTEAYSLVSEYKMAYSVSAKQVWSQRAGIRAC